NANNNIILSEKRAFAVKNYLLNAGISTDRINCQGFGHSKPKSKDLAINRRIEVKLKVEN
ncbi:MAG: OmpA family, partial [Bacteroidota bacterium]